MQFGYNIERGHFYYAIRFWFYNVVWSVRAVRAAYVRYIIINKHIYYDLHVRCATNNIVFLKRVSCCSKGL